MGTEARSNDFRPFVDDSNLERPRSIQARRLGLVIARKLVLAGAHVSICARRGRGHVEEAGIESELKMPHS